MIDLVLAAVIGASALFGLLRGFIGALASLLAWLLAGWVAFHYGAQVAGILAEGGTPGATELFGGYALSFIVVMIVVGLIGWLVRLLVKAVGLSALDRLLGLALGLARGALVACILVLLAGFTDLPREPSWAQSRLVPALLPGAQWLSRWLVGMDRIGTGILASARQQAIMASFPPSPPPLDEAGAQQAPDSPPASN